MTPTIEFLGNILRITHASETSNIDLSTGHGALIRPNGNFIEVAESSPSSNLSILGLIGPILIEGQTISFDLDESANLFRIVGTTDIDTFIRQVPLNGREVQVQTTLQGLVLTVWGTQNS